MKTLLVLFATVFLASCGGDSYDCELFAQTIIDCVPGETQDEFDEKVGTCESLKDMSPELIDCYEAAGTDCAAFIACGP